MKNMVRISSKPQTIGEMAAGRGREGSRLGGEHFSGAVFEGENLQFRRLHCNVLA